MNERHILVVDDDTLTSYALKDHLVHQRYSVTVAERCQEAREALSGSLKIDLMILDYLMPDGHGTDLLYAMAEDARLQKPQVIISSCVIDPDSRSWEALRRRLPDVSRFLIQAYVNKPYTFDSIDSVINLILNASESRPPMANEIRTGDYESADPPTPPSGPEDLFPQKAKGPAAT